MQRTGAVIDGGCAKVGRYDAERNAKDRTDNHRGDHQLHGRGQAIHDILRDRAACYEGGSHIPPQKVGDVDRIAFWQTL